MKIQSFINGFGYQSKLFLIAIIKCKDTELCAYSEVEEAHKLDDIVLKLSDGFRFFQAKAVKKPKLYSLSSFFVGKNNPFNLFKYFTSFCHILQEKKFNNVIDVVLCTSQKLEISNLRKDFEKSPFLESTEPDYIFDEMQKGDCKYDKIGKRFKINKNCKDTLEEEFKKARKTEKIAWENKEKAK